MTVLFAGGEDSDFTCIGATISVNTGVSAFESAYSRCGLTASAYNSPITIPKPFSPVTEAWLHWRGGGNTMAVGDLLQPVVGFCDQDNVPAITIVKTAITTDNYSIVFRYNDGTGNIVQSSAKLIPFSHAADFDFRVKITGTTLLCEWYRNGELMADHTATLVSTYSISNINLYRTKLVASSGSDGLFFSQIVVADEPTIGMKVYTRPPTGNGGVQEFTGGYAAIDEVTVDSSDSISTPTSARSSFTRAALTLSGTQTIRAVSVSSHGNSFTDTLASIKNFLRIGSTNYDGDTIDLSMGNTKVMTVWNVDPSTGVKWDDTLVKGTTIEFGVSVT